MFPKIVVPQNGWVYKGKRLFQVRLLFVSGSVYSCLCSISLRSSSTWHWRSSTFGMWTPISWVTDLPFIWDPYWGWTYMVGKPFCFVTFFEKWGVKSEHIYTTGKVDGQPLPCINVYHGPLQIATFWEWLAIYFHYGVTPISRVKL